MVHKSIGSILRNNGIQGKLYLAITSMYDAKAKVRAGGDLTDCYIYPHGLKQGEVSSTVLFSLSIHELVKQQNQHGRPIPELIGVVLLLFGDDASLMLDILCGLRN